MSEIRLNAPENRLAKTRPTRHSGRNRRGVDEGGKGDDDVSRLRARIAFSADESPHASAQCVVIDWHGGQCGRDHRAKVVGVGNAR